MVLKTIYTRHMRIFVDDLDLSNQFAAAAAAAHATKRGSSITAATSGQQASKDTQLATLLS